MNTLNVLLLRHIFLFQDLVHLGRRGWTLELLTVQQLILQLGNSLNQKRHFHYWWDFVFPPTPQTDASGDSRTLPVLAKASPILRLRPP